MLTLWRPTTTQEKGPQTLAQHNHLVLSHTHSGCTMGGLESCLGSTRLSPKKLAVAGLPAGAQSSAQAQEPSRDTAGGQPVRPEPPRVAIPRQPSRAQVGVGPSRADMVSGCVNGCTGSHKLLASECDLKGVPGCVIVMAEVGAGVFQVGVACTCMCLLWGPAGESCLETCWWADSALREAPQQSGQPKPMVGNPQAGPGCSVAVRTQVLTALLLTPNTGPGTLRLE